jgi:hypothetical protein
MRRPTMGKSVREGRRREKGPQWDLNPVGGTRPIDSRDEHEGLVERMGEG